MGKLIFADSLTSFVNKVPYWREETDPYYYSIAFTGDGYLLTHGKQFALSLVDKLEDLVGINIKDGTVSLSGKNINTNSSSFKLPVYKIESNEKNPISSTNENGVVTVDHKEATEFDTTGLTTMGGFSADNYTINLPKLKVDKFGHVAEIDVANAISINFVKQNLTSSTTDTYYLLGTTATTTGNTETYFNKTLSYNNGTLTVSSIKEGDKLLSFKYVQANKVGLKDGKDYHAQGSYAGIVNLSDSIDSELNTEKGKTAATPAAVKAAVAKALENSKALFASNDAMIFMGTIKPDGTIISHNTNVASINNLNITNDNTKISALTHFEAGWTFKFAFEGAEQTFTLGGKSWKVEQGDMLVCTSTGNSATAAQFDVVQTNVENQVIASDTSLTKGILIASGTGRVIESIGVGNAGQSVIFDGTNITWGDVVNNWRPIQVKGTEVLDSGVSTGALNFAAGTGIDLSYTAGTETAAGKITINNTSPLSDALALKFMNGNAELASYNPSSTALNIKFGNNIIQGTHDQGVITVEHKTIGTARNTEDLYSLVIDQYGHITKSTAISSLGKKLDNSIKLTVGTNSVEFNNSASKEIKFQGNGDLSVSGVVNGDILTVTSSLTHKYKEINFYASTTAAQAFVSSGNTTASLNLYAGDNVEFKNDNSKLTINSINTWRSVSAYTLSNLNDNNSTNDTLESVLNNTPSTTIGTNALKFGDEFVYDGDEIKLVWTEINGNTVTYKT